MENGLDGLSWSHITLSVTLEITVRILIALELVTVVGINRGYYC